MPPITPAQAQLLSQGINAVTQVATNAQNQSNAQRLFKQESNQSLAFWNQQNAYNHPSAQMARLKEAGLNPNLVYGNGATTTAQAISSPSGQSPRGEAPKFDLGAVSSAYFDTELKKLAIDQGKENIAVTQQEKINKALQAQYLNQQIQKLGVDTDQGKFNLQQSNRLAEYSVEAARLGNVKTKQDIAVQQGDYVIRQLKNGSDLKEALVRMAYTKQQTESEKLRQGDLRLQPQKTQQLIQQINEQTNLLIQQINNAQKDGILKDLETQMRKTGLNNGDPALLRLLNTFLSNL